MSESCFVLSKDFASLIILTRSLSSSSSSTTSTSMMVASAYEKFKSDINYSVNLCLDTLHDSKIEWTPLPTSRRLSNVMRLSELDSLIEWKKNPYAAITLVAVSLASRSPKKATDEWTVRLRLNTTSVVDRIYLEYSQKAFGTANLAGIVEK